MLGVFAVTTNFLWQIYQKPAEVVALLGWSENKSHSETWSTYSDFFEQYSTRIITPHFLAALAQIESGGNPLATPQWKFRLTDRLSKIFSPQSSSVGLYQFTSGTFEKAKQYCIRNGEAQKANCWLNTVYARIFPSHSIEVASAYLDTEVRRLMKKHKKRLNKNMAQNLAGVIHLCGSHKAEIYFKSGFDVRSLGKCGSHNPRTYLKRLRQSRRAFKRLSQDETSHPLS